MDNKQNKQIVVLGMHRSGTSTVARILSEVGINMGERLLGASSSNPMGHFEDADFFDLNNEIFSTLDADWMQPPEVREVELLGSKFSKRIKEILENRGRVYGVKEPKLCFTISLIQQFLDNPYYIIVHRREAAVVNSLNVRNGTSEEDGKALYRKYNNALEGFLTTVPENRVLSLNYEDLIANPNEGIRLILKFTDIGHQHDVERIAKTIYNKQEMKFQKMLYLIRAGLRAPWIIPGYLKRRFFR